ncbi:hypothetical protein [Pseudophaeobacter sp. C1-32P7]|uniref:DUF6950 family protein n=1 Tax=Pseudophaeobacter sp. C1-32P7 TaxID=3098142 RepID=UPI0034D48373
MSDSEALHRLPDWRQRLEIYVQRVARSPFRPGQNDCALFAAGAVEAMTGADLAAEWRGTYRRLEDGQAALKSAGFADHLALAASYFAEVPPALAQVGDLAVIPAEGTGAALGVIQGAAVYVMHPSGLGIVSRMRMKRAFKV